MLGGAPPWLPEDAAAFGWVLLAVVLFTTPWDNLAVKWGIWGFPPGKYLRRLWYLPVEEYAFFLLQSLNVMLAVRALFRFFPDWLTGIETAFGPITGWLLAASLLPWVFIALHAHWMNKNFGPCVHYLCHLLWFLPVIYAQWVMAPPLFYYHAGLCALVTCAFGIYYTLADLVAVRADIWFFDEDQITGLKLFGLLPWEEIAFFFLTSLLVAQSYLLLAPPDAR